MSGQREKWSPITFVSSHKTPPLPLPRSCERFTRRGAQLAGITQYSRSVRAFWKIYGVGPIKMEIYICPLESLSTVPVLYHIYSCKSKRFRSNMYSRRRIFIIRLWRVVFLLGARLGYSTLLYYISLFLGTMKLVSPPFSKIQDCSLPSSAHSVPTMFPQFLKMVVKPHFTPIFGNSPLFTHGSSKYMYLRAKYTKYTMATTKFSIWRHVICDICKKNWLK